MIYLTFYVEDLTTVRLVYDQIQVQSSDYAAGPFTTVTGTGVAPSIFPIDISTGTSPFTASDSDGEASTWYRSRYYSTASLQVSGWSDPILGEEGVIYYSPLYPPEVAYGTDDQLVIDRIRRLIGDPVGLRREYGDEALSSVHFDNKTYSLDEKGWPVDVHVANVPYSSSTDPAVNGYRYLVFESDITVTTWSGCTEYGIDVWYYTFRNSDREIMEAYDTCPPPVGLTITTANSEAYMLQTAYELLYSELLLDTTEDGAEIRDEGTAYNATTGQEIKRRMLEGLKKRLDDLVTSLRLTGITGILVD